MYASLSIYIHIYVCIYIYIYICLFVYQLATSPVTDPLDARSEEPRLVCTMFVLFASFAVDAPDIGVCKTRRLL